MESLNCASRAHDIEFSNNMTQNNDANLMNKINLISELFSP